MAYHQHYPVPQPPHHQPTAAPKAAKYVLLIIVSFVAGMFIAGVMVVGKYTYDDPRELPSPLSVVEKYMTALADGSFSTARHFDGEGFVNGSFITSSNNFALVSDSMTKNPGPTTIDSPEATVVTLDSERGQAEVNVKYTLTGKAFSEDLTLRWDKSDKKWILTSTLAGTFVVKANGPDGDEEPSSSVHAVHLYQDGREQREWVAYPAVYTVTLNCQDCGIEDLTCPTLNEEILVEPSDQGKKEAQRVVFDLY